MTCFAAEDAALKAKSGSEWAAPCAKTQAGYAIVGRSANNWNMVSVTKYSPPSKSSLPAWRILWFLPKNAFCNWDLAFFQAFSCKNGTKRVGSIPEITAQQIRVRGGEYFVTLTIIRTPPAWAKEFCTSVPLARDAFKALLIYHYRKRREIGNCTKWEETKA